MGTDENQDAIHMSFNQNRVNINFYSLKIKKKKVAV